MNVLLPTLDQHLQVLHGCETLNISISSNMLMLDSTILYLVGTVSAGSYLLSVFPGLNMVVLLLVRGLGNA